ncbi:MAG TPA: phosphatidylglycerol lysyltransferase domain-containing protein [Nocardioidaceae bacterium]|nr:phosphatidylglycerol lysyltransferase domain-containing protein [Nocardioidaceae bacterium]
MQGSVQRRGSRQDVYGGVGSTTEEANVPHSHEQLAARAPQRDAPSGLYSLWRSLRSPFWLARIVGVVGAVTLASAILPAVRDRMHLINEMVPPVWPVAADTGAAAVGLVLIVLSRALRRAKFRAWLVATVLTAAAVGLHLLKGLDVEEALLCAALFVLLVSARKEFTAKPDPRSLRRLGTVVVVGTALATGIGWAWLSIDADGEAPGTSALDRITQAFLGLMGISGPVRFTDVSDSNRAAVALVVLGASVVLFSVLVALQPAGGPHPLTGEEDGRLRGLLDRWGSIDSLSYFATRSDRSVIFSPTGKSALTYRVVGTVSLAAGDPLGDPEAWPGVIAAWLGEAREFGWVPAVLATSERGAEAFHRAGMDALELGDEAILRVGEFSLEGRSMRVVRQAVSRCARAGLCVTCHRAGDLDEATRAIVLERAEQWRDGAVERGFSMALGRFGDPADADSVVVLCRDRDGELRGLLHFVPWGADGLSLDLMRRDRDTENGIVEHMVAALMAAAPALGVSHVSLNFAVFRSVFARGERLGAGPVLRLWRSLLLALSRFWQIESLYRANAKYQPEWVPRFVCFRSSADLPRVGVAALRAEAFIVAPRWLQRVARA